MRKPRYKLPEDPKARKQVKTYMERHGRNAYKDAGRKGGGPNSPGSFTSERARLAGIKSGEARAAKRAQQLKEEEAQSAEH